MFCVCNQSPAAVSSMKLAETIMLIGVDSFLTISDVWKWQVPIGTIIHGNKKNDKENPYISDRFRWQQILGIIMEPGIMLNGEFCSFPDIE
ncbi:unnamed protein product [Adineta ricciae]|uniref:Uncharacterized protein n=1 Tax=Adineta ricciae TaxID=249248 RepID=A0A816DZC3_ADIRI|nr:unnamed protein product [Adineta ricciae]